MLYRPGYFVRLLFGLSSRVACCLGCLLCSALVWLRIFGSTLAVREGDGGGVESVLERCANLQRGFTL